jgi:archaemetzincin
LQLAQPVDLPQSAWYAPRARYRADSIIHWLAKRTGDSVIYIGITTKDVSTTSDGIKDWGVMGLGYQPGNACVVSTFRLSKNNVNDQLYKVCLHELGHNLGLPHCEVKSCFMRAGEGHNYTEEETSFCDKCRHRLERKGLVFK